jgi:hypothetical protein
MRSPQAVTAHRTVKAVAFPQRLRPNAAENRTAIMYHPKTTRRCASVLLATAVLWLVMVTLCSTNALAEVPHEHEPAGHDHHTPGQDHHESSCGCESIQAFAAPTFAGHLVKVPLADATGPGPIFIFSYPDVASFDVEAGLISRSSTSPPERISFAELVLQRCRQSQAPPRLA